jgi:acid phosphatase (class A)
MRRWPTKAFLIVAAVVALAAPVIGETQGNAGYLTPEAFNILPVLPPAPVKGDARYAADRAIFKTTREWFGTARWDFATADIQGKPADMLRNFSCAVGVTLTPDNAPKLAALVVRAGKDTSRETNAAKDKYQRHRPFHIDKVPDSEICESVTSLGDSYDYPSGHTTWGWTWATILAELEPDHAAAILARGRAYGESRVVCGAHNASAVEAGRLSASVTLTAVRAAPEYKSDFAAAQAELDALRKSGAVPDAATCQKEAELVGEDILTPHK